MNFKEAAKAYIAAAIAFFTSLTTLWVADSQFEIYYIVASIGPALAAFLGVFYTKNEPASDVANDAEDDEEYLP